ncbi:MAG TPA: hypothetical protein ENN31_01175 [Candidatus Vogelbacteria bacterium]|mgnify:CR=1 FL=1|nr:hypothetical protein [Candidatus Vogelbacteria bacterium]
MSSDHNEYSKITELEKKLFQEKKEKGITPPSDLSPLKKKVPEKWQQEAPRRKKKIFSFNIFLGGIFILSLIFFIGVAVFAFWAFSRDYNIVSNRNIDIDFQTPSLVKAGDRVSIRLTIVNRNNIALNEAVLILSLPENSRSPDDLSFPLTTWREELGTIEPGEMRNLTIAVVLFGQENEEKDFSAIMEYRVAGSNTPFAKRSSHKLVISTPPVSIFVDLIPEVISGQDIVIEARAVSNAALPLQGVVFEVSYPRGFVFSRSEPPPVIGDNFWRLGDLPTGAERRIKIFGTISGQEEEIKPFQFRIGLSEGRNDLQTILGEIFSLTSISRSFLGANIIINNSSLPEVVVAPGSEVVINIDLVNNLQENLLDNRLELSFAGQPIDDLSFRVTNGFYRASERTAFWDKRTFPALNVMSPGVRERVSLRFNLSSLTALGRSPFYNPTIGINLAVISKRIAEGFPDEETRIDIQRVVKIHSDFRATARAFYTQGPFINYGPLPPRVDRETTYTIGWSLINSSNDLRDVEVRGFLPPYVSWLSNISPENENISYNANTGEIIWRVSDLPAGTGFDRPTREAFFQVSLRPTVADIGRAPNLISRLSYGGFDTFTESNLTGSLRNLDTNLIAESGFDPKWAEVVQ